MAEAGYIRRTETEAGSDIEYHIFIFWFVALACGSGLAMLALRPRMAKRGWLLAYVSTLAVAVMGWWRESSLLVYVSALLWMFFILLPAYLSGRYHQRLLQQRYGSARRLAWVIAWLHPADGWREQPRVVEALELGFRGQFTEAKELLNRVQEGTPDTALAAGVHFYRITSQWEELLEWLGETKENAVTEPQLLPVLLRAHGETGNVPALIELYEQHKEQVARLAPLTTRDLCRLMLFAFTGQGREVERLLEGTLRDLPLDLREFWLATADLAAGKKEAARSALEGLLAGADPSMKLAIERRLGQVESPPPVLAPEARLTLEEATREQQHEETFGSARSLFSRAALGTQLLIVVNVLVFAAEVALGGATNPETLMKMGAMYPPEVRGGDWWRLIAALFLHFGPLHLGMNMLGLWLLGPFTEFGLGFRRFLLLYLSAGIGSMAVVMFYGSGPDGNQITLGASGSVLGLVGATGALMLRGWLRERAHAAKRRFMTMIFIVAMQTVFDSVVPKVSMTAHLSGAVLGFGIALLLPDRLRPAQKSAQAAEAV